jgi:hypothetical protein
VKEECVQVNWWTGEAVCGSGHHTAQASEHPRWRVRLLLRSAGGDNLLEGE